jgi:hypothetical protein
MLGLFIDSKSVELLEEYLEEQYNLSEYILTWILTIIFFKLHDYFVYQTYVPTTLMKYILIYYEFYFLKICVA